MLGFLNCCVFMTLNLTLVTPKDVYQCSDFRLTYTDRPGHYNNDEAQKIIVISTLKWSAFLLQFARYSQKHMEVLIRQYGWQS